MVPKDAQVLIPGTDEYVTLHGKGVFADVINNLENGDDLGLSGLLQCHHKRPYTREAGRSQTEKEMGGHRNRHNSTEQKESDRREVADLTEQGRGHQPRNAGAIRIWKRLGNILHWSR